MFVFSHQKVPHQRSRQLGYLPWTARLGYFLAIAPLFLVRIPFAPPDHPALLSPPLLIRTQQLRTHGVEVELWGTAHPYPIGPPDQKNQVEHGQHAHAWPGLGARVR